MTPHRHLRSAGLTGEPRLLEILSGMYPLWEIRKDGGEWVAVSSTTTLRAVSLSGLVQQFAVEDPR